MTLLHSSASLILYGLALALSLSMQIILNKKFFSKPRGECDPTTQLCVLNPQVCDLKVRNKCKPSWYDTLISLHLHLQGLLAPTFST
jgi:hypothetical protein